MPNSDDDALRLECTLEAFEALHPRLQEAIRRAARRYHDARPDEPAWRVTSARRTLRRQAELMAACTPEQLLAMYASRGRPQYIDAILAAAQPLDADAVYAILQTRTEGYISRHLFGAAADLGANGVADPALLKRLLAAEGAAVLDERECGIPCYHVAWPDAPVQIVRE